MVKKFIYFIVSCFLLHGHSVAQEKDSIIHIGISIAEEMPVFKGNLSEFIQNKIQYPESAKSDSIQGRVFVSFWVDTTGVTINHHIVKGIRVDLDNEALRITKLIVFDKPAMQRGKPIKIKYTMPIEFILAMQSEIKKKRCKK